MKKAITSDGLAAVRTLLDRAYQAGTVPPFELGALDPVGSAPAASVHG
ncbi:hypothetical protein [Streptomyces umbrinus]|nr:hypothetical protein [Streptomyces umbrinus]